MSENWNYPVELRGDRPSIELHPFYLFTHGDTPDSEAGLLCGGSSDPSLTDHGKRQSSVIGIAMQNVPFTKVYCSELKRTQETTELSLPDGTEVIIDPRLNERDFGPFERRKLSDEERNALRHGDLPGVEPFLDFLKRVFDFAEEMLCEKGVTISTHRCVARAFALYFLAKLEPTHIKTGACLHFHMDIEWNWTVHEQKAICCYAVQQHVEARPPDGTNQWGPLDDDFSRNSVKGLRDILDQYDIPVTYCMHAEELEVHKGTIKADRLAYRNAYAAHTHPHVNKFHGYSGPLSANHFNKLPDDEKARLHKWQKERSVAVAGFTFKGFSAGDLSGDKHVFDGLAKAGYGWTSCSEPGRHYPAKGADWRNAPRGVYKAFETPDGRVLYEVPLSVDSSVTIEDHEKGWSRYLNKSPDGEWNTKGHSYDDISTRWLDQTLDARQGILHSNWFIHNKDPFSEPNHPATQRVHAVIRADLKALATYGIVLRGATVAEIARRQQDLDDGLLEQRRQIMLSDTRLEKCMCNAAVEKHHEPYTLNGY